MDRLNRAWQWLKAYWSKLTLAIVAVLILAPVAAEWWEERQAENTKRERTAAIDAVNTGASIAGDLLASAYRNCTQIGIGSIERCAEYEGKLLQEMTGPISARLALAQRKAYDERCLTLYDSKYCYELLNRAFQLTLAQPESRGRD